MAALKQLSKPTARVRRDGRSVELPAPKLVPGDVVAYRCRDCADMWYLEVDEDDLEDDGRGRDDSPPDDGRR